MNLVPRLFDVDRGRITIDGQDIRTVTQKSLRAAIGMVPPTIQTPCFLALLARKS